MKYLMWICTIALLIAGAFYIGMEFQKDARRDRSSSAPPMSAGDAPAAAVLEDTDGTGDEDHPLPTPKEPLPVTELDRIVAGQRITFPLEVIGRAPGAWFDRQYVRVQVRDDQGTLVGETLASTRANIGSDTDLVPFHGAVEQVTYPGTDTGILVVMPVIFKNLADEYRLPIRFYEGGMPDTLRVTSPLKDQLITSPLVVKGSAAGWYFEATFSIHLYDANNQEIASHYVTAQDDWMTPAFVPFLGTLEFEPPETATGTLAFKKANPRGEGDTETFLVPVTFE